MRLLFSDCMVLLCIEMARCSNQTHISDWVKWIVFGPMFAEVFRQWNFHLCIIWMIGVECGWTVCVDGYKMLRLIFLNWNEYCQNWCKTMHEPSSDSNAKRTPQNNTKPNAMEFYWFHLYAKGSNSYPIPYTKRRTHNSQHCNVHDALFSIRMKIFVKCQ